MKSSSKRFTDNVRTEYSHEAKRIMGMDFWRVCNGFTYYLHEDESEWVEIPVGFLTNGASVPRVFWSLIPPWGDHTQAAIVHDFLCEYLEVQTNEGPREITRKEADEIFYESLIDAGVDPVKSYIMGASVDLYRIVMRRGRSDIDVRKRFIESRWRSLSGR